MSTELTIPQIIKIDRSLVNNENTTICLSNGDILYYSLFWCEWRKLSNKSKVVTNFKRYIYDSKGEKNHPDGALVYKSGDNYELVELEKKNNLTIVKVSKHEISSEVGAFIKCDFSYSSFNKACFNKNGLLAKNIILNIYFDDGSNASINALDDPIWLDAKAGMSVEHFTFKTLNIYKLL